MVEGDQNQAGMSGLTIQKLPVLNHYDPRLFVILKASGGVSGEFLGFNKGKSKIDFVSSA
jgi:hypothetical protein